MQTVTLTGSQIKIYINGAVYGPAQSISFAVDRGESEIYGIDSPFPQEIAATKIASSGQIQGLRIGGSGGLQAKGILSKLKDVLSSPYITIRITDRKTGEDIAFCPQAKVTNESHSVAAKGRYSLSFSFKAVAIYSPLDRS